MMLVFKEILFHARDSEKNTDTTGDAARNMNKMLIISSMVFFAIPQLAVSTSTNEGNDKNTEHAQEKNINEGRAELCDKAQKNLKLLRDKAGSRTFRTNQGEIVRYSTEEINDMIKDNESLVLENCEEQ